MNGAANFPPKAQPLNRLAGGGSSPSLATISLLLPTICRPQYNHHISPFLLPSKNCYPNKWQHINELSSGRAYPKELGVSPIFAGWKRGRRKLPRIDELTEQKI